MSSRKLLYLTALTVGVALLYRWWVEHTSRTSRSHDDPLLTKVVDVIVPAQAPAQLGASVGGRPVQNWIPLATSSGNPAIDNTPPAAIAVPPGAMPMTNGVGKYDYETPPIYSPPPPVTGVY